MSTVGGAGARLFGLSSMSSNYHRTSRVDRRIIGCISSQDRYFTVTVGIERRHAAVNNRQCVSGDLGSRVGGETGERRDTTCGVDRGGGVASQSRRGFRAVLLRRLGFLSGRRQSGGEMRDAARAACRGGSRGR